MGDILHTWCSCVVGVVWEAGQGGMSAYVMAEWRFVTGRGPVCQCQEGR